MLIEVAHPQAGADTNCARRRLDLTEGQLHESALAGAVGTGDAQPLAAKDVEGQVLEQCQIAERLAQVLASQDDVAGVSGLAEREADRLLVGGLVQKVGILFEQTLQAGLAASGGAAHAFLVLVAGDEVERLLNHLDAFGVLPLLLEPHGLPGLRVGSVAAVPDLGLAILHLDDLADDLVEQIAVVADDDRGPPIGRQESLQPLGGLEIEVVGGFIQQQKVGFEHQDLGQAEPRELPAAQCRGPGVVQLGLEAHRRQGRVDANLVFVASRQFEIAAQTVVLGHLGLEGRPGQAFHLLGNGVDVGLELQQVVDAGVHLLHHRPQAAEGGFLRQVADPQALLPDDASHVGLDGPCDELENGALARAVRADHADLLARVERHGQLVEHDLRSEGFMDVL